MREGLIQIEGDWWPASDAECRPAVTGHVQDVDIAIELCRHSRVAVQAGGNCGIWPRHLAKRFDVVYTFEPDADNFMCLSLNAPAPNIIKMQAALGNRRTPVSLLVTPHNVGAHRVLESEGSIPQIRIDDLNLPACDFIQLDIEGFEYFALRGAMKTIAKFRPVIMLEDKRHHEKYGVPRAKIEDLFKVINYRVCEKVSRDIILLPG